MNINRIKEIITNWKHSQINKKILKKKQELRILKSEIRRIEIELAGLNYDLQKSILGG